MINLNTFNAHKLYPTNLLNSRLLCLCGLWSLIWFSLNAESAQRDGSLTSYFHLARFSLPYVAAVISIGWMWFLRVNPALQLWQIGLIGYASIVLISGYVAGHPVEYLHFHAAVLCAGIVTILGGMLAKAHSEIDEIDVATSLMVTGFFILAAVTVIFFARDLFHAFNANITQGYNIQPNNITQFGMEAPRPTGNARSATIISVACLLVYSCKLARVKLVYIISCLFMALLIFYQARGSIVALIASLFILALILPRAQWPSPRSLIKFIALTVALFGLILSILYIPQAIEVSTTGSFSAPSPFRDFIPAQVGSGRLGHWSAGFTAFLTSPVIGLGGQADRIHIDENVSSMIVYTLLCGGAVGLVFALTAIYRPLQALLRLISDTASLPVNIQHRCIILIAASTFTFLSARGIFENSYALFNIDFLMVVPPIWILSLTIMKSDKV